MANVSDPVVLMADDDITRVYALIGFNKRPIENPDTIRQIVEHAGQCAVDAGAAVFGFNQAPDVRKVLPMRPFSLASWIGCFEGTGGNAKNRSAARHQQELNYLARKWGRYLRISKGKGVVRLTLGVDR